MDGIQITITTEVLREFYLQQALDAEMEAKVSESVLATCVKEADANNSLLLQVSKSIGCTRAVQATTRAAVWRFLRDNTPPGATVAMKPQELLDLGIRIAKGAGA